MTSEASRTPWKEANCKAKHGSQETKTEEEEQGSQQPSQGQAQCSLPPMRLCFLKVPPAPDDNMSWDQASNIQGGEQIQSLSRGNWFAPVRIQLAAVFKQPWYCRATGSRYSPQQTHLLSKVILLIKV